MLGLVKSSSRALFRDLDTGTRTAFTPDDRITEGPNNDRTTTLTA